MTKLFTVILSLAVVFILTISVSCESEVSIPEDAFNEQSRSHVLAGSWSIVSATRNGTDMTDRFDFSEFRLNVAVDDQDNVSYSLSNLVPFLVSSDGTITFDDPAYPFAITFTESGQSTGSIANLSNPLIPGAQLQLEFSAGCDANVYAYSLEKTQNQQ